MSKLFFEVKPSDVHSLHVTVKDNKIVFYDLTVVTYNMEGERTHTESFWKFNKEGYSITDLPDVVRETMLNYEASISINECEGITMLLYYPHDDNQNAASYCRHDIYPIDTAYWEHGAYVFTRPGEAPEIILYGPHTSLADTLTVYTIAGYEEDVEAMAQAQFSDGLFENAKCCYDFEHLHIEWVE